jgi:tetratricopeptide (TPR) repeat protein
MPRRPLLATAYVGLLLGVASVAQADEIADFEEARQAYEAQAYEQAVSLFESMVGGEVPRIRNEILILESRKYLGAAYLFVGREEAAESQFATLLRADPSYELDPVAFPEDVQRVFRDVRERIAAELAAAERQREAADERLRQETLDQLLAQQERIARLEALAREEVVERPNSRLIATVPFGVGQLQNGHLTLGRFFAVSEATMVAGTIGTWAAFQWATNQVEDETIDNTRPQRIRRVLKPLNITMFSLLGALVVIGIIDAHVRFVPLRREVRERELPDDLRQPLPAATLGLGVGTLDFRLEF